MNDRVWNSGSPPHVGWWNASTRRMVHTWRWWDGKEWSLPAYPDYEAELAGAQAEWKAPDAGPTEWTDYYPENARVPRVAPTAVKRNPEYYYPSCALMSDDSPRASRHTLGPWQLLPAEPGVPYLRVRGVRLGGKYKIANVYTEYQFEAGQDHAIAKLISLAPTLLVMVKEARIRVTPDWLAASQSLIDAIEGAYGGN